jgi:NAD(P)-dependent dehydrogenase (short-subunit alcohol dehydrogenase family)
MVQEGMSMAGRLNGKVAIVTGAGCQGGGIGNGKAAAILFAREGARILCVDRIEERAQETVAAIEAAGGTAAAFQCDVTRQEDCRRMARAAVDHFGRVDILQNNVGIASDQTLEEVTEEAWDSLMTINVRSVVMAAQAAVPHMAAGGGGSIINITSIAGLRAYPPPMIAYTTTKTAIIGLTMALAGQLGGRRIRVNAVAIGQVYAPAVSHLGAEARQRRAAAGLIKEEGTPWDVGWTSVFLASDEARWITGQVLPVDAGISITIPGNEYR